MLRRVLAVFLVGCGSPSAVPDAADAVPDAAPPGWTWRFVDPSGTDVGCPADVDTVELIAYQNTMMVGECLQGPYVVARASFPCAQGIGQIMPMGPQTPGCAYINGFLIHVLARTTDGRVYANKSSGASVEPGNLARGNTDIEVPRGYVRLAWTIETYAGTPSACDPDSVVMTSIAPRPATDDCALGSAILAGTPPGGHDIDVWVGKWYAGSPRTYAVGKVTVDVVADSITDASVTLKRYY
jgi:hypothetical protein